MNTLSYNFVKTINSSQNENYLLYVCVNIIKLMARVVAKKHIKDFMDTHSNHRLGLEAWLSIVESSVWKKPQDIVDTFGAKATDKLGKKNTKKGTKSCDRVVIDVKGNHLRIIAKYQFSATLKKSILYLKWIGTHAEYNKLKREQAQYDIDMFN